MSNIVDNPAITSHYDISKICKHLLENLKITFFRFLRVYKDGSRIHLCSNPGWTDHFYQNHFYNVAWLDVIINIHNERFSVLWDQKAVCEDNVVGIDAREIFNIYHGVSFLRPYKKYFEVYDFATNKENFKLNEKYESQRHYFEHFIFYFLDKAKNIISDAEKNKLTRSNVLLNLNLVPQHKEESRLPVQKIKNFLLRIGQQEVYISEKEMRAIYWKVYGKTSKEIAMITYTSQKTIESHLESVRKKLNCTINYAIKLIIESGAFYVFRTQYENEKM